MFLPLTELEPLVDQARAACHEQSGFRYWPRMKVKGGSYAWCRKFRDNPIQRFADELLAPGIRSFAIQVISNAGEGLIPHIDAENRLAAINFPLSGDWERSTLHFYEGEEVVGSYLFGPPVLIRTDITHGVDNRGCRDREILSIGFHSHSFDELVELRRRGELFSSKVVHR